MIFSICILTEVTICGCPMISIEVHSPFGCLLIFSRAPDLAWIALIVEPPEKKMADQLKPTKEPQRATTQRTKARRSAPYPCQ